MKSGTTPIPHSGIPSGFTPDMVGKVITVQLFDREPNDPDTIIPSSLKKFVGKLQGYQIEPTRWAFALEGIPPVQVKNGRYAEIFPIELSVPKPH